MPTNSPTSSSISCSNTGFAIRGSEPPRSRSWFASSSTWWSIPAASNAPWSADEKSPLIPEVPRDQVPVLPDELWTARYEAMRKRAMTKSGSVDNSYGYALLIRRGLVAWMKAWPRPAREPPHDLGSGPRADALTVPSHLLQSAASLLVNMILSLGTATEVPYEQ